MAYIFLDESGDLGFSKGSSRYFIFTLALTTNPRELEHIVNKTRKSLRKKYKNLKELHANEADSITRKRILKQIATIEELKVLCVVLDKEKVPNSFRNKKHNLYNNIAGVLLNRLYMINHISPYEPLHIVIDQKYTNRYLRHNFEQSILESFIRNHRYPINIQIKASHEEKSLQVVDFISWALFRKYEQAELLYYDIIKNLIKEEHIVLLSQK